MDNGDRVRSRKIIGRDANMLRARDAQRDAVGAAVGHIRSGHCEPRAEGAFVLPFAQQVGNHRDGGKAAALDRQPLHRIPAFRLLFAGAVDHDAHVGEGTSRDHDIVGEGARRHRDSGQAPLARSAHRHAIESDRIIGSDAGFDRYQRPTAFRCMRVDRQILEQQTASPDNPRKLRGDVEHGLCILRAGDGQPVPHRKRSRNVVRACRKCQRVARLCVGNRGCERGARGDRTRDASAERSFGRCASIPAGTHFVARHRTKIARCANGGERRVGRIQQTVRAAFERDLALLDSCAKQRPCYCGLDIAGQCNAADCAFRPKGISPLRPDDQVAIEPAVDGRGRAFGIGTGREGDARGVDDAIALDPRIDDLVIAIDHRIGDAVHHADRALERGAGKPLQIIVAYDLIAIDHTHAARIGNPLAEEDVAFDDIAVAVPEHESALRGEHKILANDIAARFDRDDLDLAATAIEHIALDDCVTVRQRFLARPDTDRLAAVRSERWSRPEIIMIDAVPVIERIARLADDRQGNAAVRLALEMRMIDAVPGPIERDPNIFCAAVGFAEAVDHHLGDARIACQVGRIAPKGDDLGGRARAVLEDEARHHEVAPRQPQVRPTGQNDLALGLRREGNRLRRGAGADEQRLEVAPFTVGEQDGVAWLRRLDRRTELRGIGHEQVACVRRRSDRSEKREDQNRTDFHCLILLSCPAPTSRPP